MEGSTIVKCRYSNCLHESRELNKEEAVKSNCFYYHSDCFKTKEDIKKIISLFRTHINPNPVYAQLQTVIKNIVFSRGLGSDFLLFGLEYYIEHKISLNYPQGLYYVVQNKNVIDAYRKARVKDIKKSIEITEETSSEFTHVPVKNNGFADILK